MLNGKVWSVPAEIPTMARSSPPSSEVVVVIVTFSVFVGVRFSFSAAACSSAGTMVKTTSSPGLCSVTRSATSAGSFTASPSTVLITSNRFLPFRLTVAIFSLPMNTCTVPADRPVTATIPMLLARRTFRASASPFSSETMKSSP